MKNTVRHSLLNRIIMLSSLLGLTACQTQPVHVAFKADTFSLLSVQPEGQARRSPGTASLTRVRLLPAQRHLLIETGRDKATLRHALVNTLLMARNPTRTDPARLPLPIQITQEPFLYGLIVDQHQFPIASRAQAETYADWLMQHACQTLQDQGHILHRVLIPIAEGYTFHDLAALRTAPETLSGHSARTAEIAQPILLPVTGAP